MQTTLRKKRQRIRTKPSKWAEITNYNLPKPYEYSEIASVETYAIIYSLGAPET